MKKRRGEIILSALLTVVGIAAVIIIQMQKSSALSNTGATTFKTFPTVYGVLLTLLSAVNLLFSLSAAYKEERAQAQNGAQEAAENNTVTYLRVAAMFVLTLVFTILLKKINFGLLAFVFLFLSFFVLGRKKVGVNLVVSLVGSGLIYVIFKVLLKLPL